MLCAQVQILLAKTSSYRLGPADETAEKVIKRWGKGEAVLCEVKRARNPEAHRKAFALLRLVLDNQNTYSNIDDLLTEIKLRAGHYDEYVTSRGELVYTPRSIAFADMCEDEFAEFYSKMIDAMIRHILPGLGREDLEDEILRFVS